MRAVLDTVVFVRAAINPQSWWGHVLELTNRYVIVLSPGIIKEILDVFERPPLRKRIPRISGLSPAAKVLRLFEQAEVVEPAEVPRVCRDPNDDKLFACALAGKADYIVSEDKDVLDVKEYRGVRCVTAEEFLRLLAHTGGAKG